MSATNKNAWCMQAVQDAPREELMSRSWKLNNGKWIQWCLRRHRICKTSQRCESLYPEECLKKNASRLHANWIPQWISMHFIMTFFLIQLPENPTFFKMTWNFATNATAYVALPIKSRYLFTSPTVALRLFSTIRRNISTPRYRQHPCPTGCWRVIWIAPSVRVQFRHNQFDTSSSVKTWRLLLVHTENICSMRQHEVGTLPH